MFVRIGGLRQLLLTLVSEALIDGIPGNKQNLALLKEEKAGKVDECIAAKANHLDFSEAIGCVNHWLLLSKRHILEIGGRLCKWAMNVLHRRTFRVSLEK